MDGRTTNRIATPGNFTKLHVDDDKIEKAVLLLHDAAL